MALTTADAFNLFFDRINPDAGFLTRVSDRQAAVEATLARAFPSTSDITFRSARLVGSLGRSTASSPVADMDLLAHLHVDLGLWERSYRDDSTKFLYRVRKSLNSTSTVQRVGARGQAVRLFYADGLTVDVAAVEKYTSGDYAIPDGSGRWLSTNPLRHAEYIDEQNARLDGNLKRFVKIVKQWNLAHSSRLASFHLEMLAAGAFTSLDNNRRTALEAFWAYLQRPLRSRSRWVQR